MARLLVLLAQTIISAGSGYVGGSTHYNYAAFLHLRLPPTRFVQGISSKLRQEKPLAKLKCIENRYIL